MLIDLFRVAEYLDVHEKQNDYNDVPPVLMTREVLAKFRTMETEQQAAKQKLPVQRTQVRAYRFVSFFVRNIQAV